MYIFVAFIAGVLFGIGVTGIIFLCSKSGTLRVDSSDYQDGPYLFLELDRDVAEMIKKQYVFLKIEPNSFRSHK